MLLVRKAMKESNLVKFPILYILRLITAYTFLLLSILAVLGIFYPIEIFDFQLGALIQRFTSDFSIPAAISIITVFLITFFFGRVYCSCICPLGIIQELFSFIAFKKTNEIQGNYFLKYIISAITIGTIIGGSAYILKYIDPYTLFSSAISLKLSAIITIILILVIVFFKNRFFCTNICPIGAILGLISKFSVNKIYMNEECISCGMCEQNCPAGCIDSGENKINNETCLKCLKCINICPKEAIKYGKNNKKEKNTFNLQRRQFLKSIAFIGALGAGFALGVNLAKDISKKIKNVILPPGSINSYRMENKCLNCNLCIENCPNKILEKANNEFNAVHINYDKGQKFCKYDCNECSRVCPSGAIKKISKEEKQKIRIAQVIINNNCNGCRGCINLCPVKAITIKNEKAVIDDTKCIGCGKCRVFCPNKSIEIFAVKEQSVI